MIVILVPCSGRKRPGGRSIFDPSGWLDRSLRPEERHRLLAARRELGTFFGLPPAPDLGFSASQGDVGFLPAWERACPPPPGSFARGRWAALLEAPERGCYDDK
jgi:hypothetical protein